MKGLVHAGVLLLAAHQAAAKVATAVFDNDGVMGTIKFSQADASSAVTIDVALDGLAGNAGGYHVHSLPVHNGAAGFLLNGVNCGVDITSGHYNPLLVTGGPGGPAGNYSCTGVSDLNCEAGDLSGKHGALTGLNNRTALYTDADTGLTLFGANSVVGRSVVIHRADRSRWMCATILEEGVTYKQVVATYEGDVQGTITLLQDAADSSAETIVRVNLAQPSGDSVDHKWHVHETQVTVPGDCGSTGAHFNPLEVAGGDGFPSSNGKVPGTYNCTSANNFAGCEVGDLSGKHGPLALSSSGSQYQFTDTNLPLTGANAITSRSIVFHAADLSGNRYVCADLVPAKVVAATFYNEGVQGTIKLTQNVNSPVIINVELDGLASTAGGYHVHSFPVNSGGSGYLLNGVNCGVDITSGHYNPLLVTGGPGGPAGTYSCTGVSDLNCEAGDLSGKHGALTGLNSLTALYTDADTGLTLFGANSVVGRSVVIHKADTSRWMCATILEEGVTYKQVVATYEGDVQGTITLLQDAADPSADTIIRVNLAQPSGDSVDHKWHVHETRVNVPGNCGSTGAHFNPLEVAGGDGFPSSNGKVPGTYDCTSANNFAGCEVGDLSGKHGLLALAQGGSQYVFTDTNLPLSGANAVTARSIVFHAAGASGSRYVCADLGRTAVATFDAEGVTGTITFYQGAQGDDVTVDFDLYGLNATGGKYHVHEYPANGGGCGGDVTGAHFNPLQVPGGDGYPSSNGKVPGTYLCTSTNGFVGCEAGDLSGQFGRWDGLDVYNETTKTSAGVGLDLFGKASIVGRAIVVHKNDATATRWICTTIQPTLEQTVQQSTFSNGEVSGRVVFSQAKVDAGAGTSVLVDLERSSATSPHKWHVHELPVSSDCASTGGHYNPEGINGGAGFTGSAYPSYLCSESMVDYCEVGDMNGKLGTIDLPTLGFFTDIKLPLSGPNSVSDRSIVVHETDGSRLACANLAAPPTASPTASPTVTPVVEEEEEEQEEEGIPLAATLGAIAGVFAVAAAFVLCMPKTDIGSSAEAGAVASSNDGDIKDLP